MPPAAVFSLRDVALIGPEVLLAAAGLLLLVAGAIGRGLSRRDSFRVSGLGVALATVLLIEVRISEGGAARLFGGSLVLDGYAFFWQILLLGALALVLLASTRGIEALGPEASGAGGGSTGGSGRAVGRASEYCPLLLIASAGAMLMVAAADLLSLWISLETMALASYVLVGIFTRERASNEAAIKYFVLGAFSSAILLYGVSLLYGATGTLDFEGLARTVPQAIAQGSRIAPLGGLLLLAGFFFKVAAAPFHAWVPDVYVGAPTPVTAFLAGLSKLASFAALGRILLFAFGDARGDWQPVLAGVAVVSMIWGNVGALTQTSVKRLLAYSSIAHAGYLLLGILAASETGLWAAMFYAAAYLFMTVGAFSVVALLHRGEHAAETCSDYAGLGKRRPYVAAAMLVFLLGLTGIPPTGGFFGKVFLFAAAVQGGWTWAAVVGVLTSALSLYFYFRIVVFMYFKPADLAEGVRAETAPTPWGLRVGIGVSALLSLGLGLYPGPLIDWVKQSLLALR